MKYDFDDWLQQLHWDAGKVRREKELNALSRDILKAFYDLECAPTIDAILGVCVRPVLSDPTQLAA